MRVLSELGPADHEAILAIINAASEAYRGVIPADCWHEPYMSASELAVEIGRGVRFVGYRDARGEVIAVMGIQPVLDAVLIRHAYVHPEHQRHGLGGKLLEAFKESTPGRMLVGTWADAGWAIRFYEKHGFALAPGPDRIRLLEKYWSISTRQIETSVVLVRA